MGKFGRSNQDQGVEQGAKHLEYMQSARKSRDYGTDVGRFPPVTKPRGDQAAGEEEGSGDDISQATLTYPRISSFIDRD